MGNIVCEGTGYIPFTEPLWACWFQDRCNEYWNVWRNIWSCCAYSHVSYNLMILCVVTTVLTIDTCNYSIVNFLVKNHKVIVIRITLWLQNDMKCKLFYEAYHNLWTNVYICAFYITGLPQRRWHTSSLSNFATLTEMNIQNTYS